MLQQIGKKIGLSDVHGKQKLVGRYSGTEWEIDAKGVRDGDGSIVIIECRRYGSRLSQEALAAVAYRVHDTGAAGGITVSPMPLQKGAAKVAKAAGIEHVRLRPDSTREQWVAEIGKVLHVGRTETAKVTAHASLEMTVFNAKGEVIDRRGG